MKRAQKIFERDPTKKNFWSSKTLRDAKAKNHEQSSWFNNNNNNNNNKNKTGQKKKSGNLMKRAQKKFERDPRKKNFLRAKPYGLVKAKNCEQSSQFNNSHV